MALLSSLADKRNKLLAGFVALIQTFRTSFRAKTLILPNYSRAIAVLLLSSLIFPLFLFGGFERAKAKTVEVAPPPVSAPPQPFRIGSSVSVRSPTILALSLGGWMKDVLTGPTLPEGFRAPNTLGFFERVSSSLASVLAIGAPKMKKEEAAPAPQPASAVDFDFDGDTKADLARWNPANTEFKIKNSNGGSYSTYTLGSASAKPVPADYDGDGLTDAATFAAGTWAIRKSSDGTTSSISFGQAGDIPASGNYRKTAADQLAYFRPSNGTWYWRELGNATVYTQGWGQSGDIAVAGDYS